MRMRMRLRLRLRLAIVKRWGLSAHDWGQDETWAANFCVIATEHVKASMLRQMHVCDGCAVNIITCSALTTEYSTVQGPLIM